MSKLLYGYTVAQDGNITVHENNATIVREIYRRYLSGESSGGIAAMLEEKQISSPSNGRWNRTAIDNILSNGKYLYKIINAEQFLDVQYEKDRRSNMNYDTGNPCP